MGRRGRLEERLDEPARLARPAPASASTSYTLALQHHGLESVEREVRWLNELIDDEATQAAPADHRSEPHRHRGHDEGVTMGSVRVAIAGVGNCAASLVQGVEYYKDADPDGARPRPDARPVRRLPRARRRVRRRVRRRRQEGRPRPRRGDRRQREQHHQDRRRAAHRRHGAARPDPRRPRQVLPRDHHRVRRRRRSTSRRRCATPRPTCWSATCRSAPRRPPSYYAQAPSTPASRFVNALPVFIAGTRSGPTSSPPPACRSSATTSRPRSAPPSRTACWPSCSRTAASSSTAPCSSTSAATWTSRTCSSASAWSPRRSPRPRPSPRSSQHDLGKDNVHIGPSDYVAWLDDRKWAYVRLEGRAFGDVPLNLEYKLEVWDSPNSAGVIIDAVRCAQDRPRPRHRRPDPVGQQLLHEVAAGAVLRRRGPRRRRGLHRRHHLRRLNAERTKRGVRFPGPHLFAIFPPPEDHASEGRRRPASSVGASRAMAA